MNQDGVHVPVRPSAAGLPDRRAGRPGRRLHRPRRPSATSPFFLELATFAPHCPYIPAPRDRHDFPGLRVPRPPSFDRLPTHAPRWLGTARRWPPPDRRINRVFRLRAQAVESVDRMIARDRGGPAPPTASTSDTYLVFSSDNGLHTGEYRLMPGKLTAFDTDIHVPLVVIGPGVRAGATTERDDRERRPRQDVRRDRRHGDCVATGTACCRCSTGARAVGATPP